MKVNEKTVKKIVNVLENSCAITTSNVRIMPDTGESDYIIRYEDGNGITISIYFSTQYDRTSLSVGFIDHDERYKTFSTTCRAERMKEEIFFFELYGTLHRCSDFALINY